MNSTKLYAIFFVLFKKVSPSFLKAFLILLCIVGIPHEMNGQEEEVINKKGTIVRVRNNIVTTAPIAPIAPIQNDVWFDTTADLTKIFDGTLWLAIAADALALKEDTVNKSTNTALGTSDVAFPTQNAVKTYVDSQVGPIKAFGKISSNGTVVRATTGVTASRTSTGRYRVTLTGLVSDGDYIIQLTQPGRGGAGLIGGAGNDDPGISYGNQDATGFDVIIGDNDNGRTDRSRFNSEFMFTILDL